MTTSHSHRIHVAPAVPADRPALEQLWTMFRHDMSAFTGVLPDRHGRFRQERLDSALQNADWAGHMLRLGGSPVGLAIVRGLPGPERIISSFFLVHGARRAGHGRAAVRAITRALPGRWAVAFQDVNAPAGCFWQAVASDADSGWRIDHEEVPGRPDLPPDSWVRFTVRPSPITVRPIPEAR